MPQIPDFRSIQRTNPQVQAYSSGYRVPEAGDGLAELSKVALDELNRRRVIEAKHDLSNAEADMSIALVSGANAYNDDQDYPTIGERFNKRMGDEYNRILDTIPDPEAKELFSTKYKPAIVEAGIQLQNRVVKPKENDANLGRFNTRIGALRDSGVTSGNIGETLAIYDALYQSGVDKGYLGMAEAQQQKDNFRESLAMGWLNAQKPEDQVNALNQVKPYIAPDVYAVEMQKAEQGLQKQETAAFAQQLLDGGVTSTAALAAIEEKYKGDPLLRQATEAEYAAGRNRRESAELDTQGEISEQLTQMMIEGTPFEKLPQNMKDSLKPSQRLSLGQKWGQMTAKTVVPYNGTFETYMSGLVMKGELANAYKTFLESQHIISNAQNDRWNLLFREGATKDDLSRADAITTGANELISYGFTEEVDPVPFAKLSNLLGDLYDKDPSGVSGQTVRETINEFLVTYKVPTPKSGQTRDQALDYARTQLEIAGLDPTDDRKAFVQMEAQIHQLYSENPSVPFSVLDSAIKDFTAPAIDDEDTMWGTLTSAEKIAQLREGDEDAGARTDAALGGKGITPTPEEWYRQFQSTKNQMRAEANLPPLEPIVGPPEPPSMRPRFRTPPTIGKFIERTADLLSSTAATVADVTAAPGALIGQVGVRPVGKGSLFRRSVSIRDLHAMRDIDPKAYEEAYAFYERYGIAPTNEQVAQKFEELRSVD